jgi:hypothetical protein
MSTLQPWQLAQLYNLARAAPALIELFFQEKN